MDNLTAADLETFARFGISTELLKQAGIERVTDQEARERFGINGSGDRAGIIFPYRDPITGQRYTARLRRDLPDIENGKPKNKYVSAWGDSRHLYFVSGCADLINDATVPVVLIEAEKSALALTAWAARTGRALLPVAMGGAWGWRARIGKKDGPNGERLDEKGPLPELRVCANRDVYVLLDSNATNNSAIRAARSALTRELLTYNARVKVATVPQMESVNGPDDLIAQAGDTAIQSVLELAVPALEVAVADAEAAIEEVRKAQPHPNPDDMRRALDAVADVPDQLQRETLEGLLAAAVRGVVRKKTITGEVAERRTGRAQSKAKFAREVRERELKSRPIDAARLIKDVESFFAERAFLPDGAALVLAYFSLNTWTFSFCDTVPYLSLESAVPGCGKSTVIRLLEALCCHARKGTALSEAVLFRLIDEERPALLIDEAEILEGRTERAAALTPIANEGYKSGGQVPRCEGDDHVIRWFDVFCPKVFAAIGGLTGALLDRCIIIHMEKAPRTSIRKSTRQRALHRDARGIVERLEAYAVQFQEKLKALYDDEPDAGYWPNITDREAELWGPLLCHARVAGPDAEANLLAVVDRFAGEKAEITSQDWHIAQAIALLEAITAHEEETFTPGDLVPALVKAESWARTLADAKGRDEASVAVARAAKVGYALRRFRLRGKKNSSGRIAYARQAAIDCFTAHVPSNPLNPPYPPDPNPPESQSTESKDKPEGTEGTEGFTDQATNGKSGPPEPSGNDGWEDLDDRR